MPKKILIEWPSLGASVKCAPMEKNTAMFDKFCELLPFHALQLHAMVAGYQLYHYAPIALDDYSNLIEWQPDLDKIDDGCLLWTGLGLIGMVYGHNTEYLTTQPIAKCVEEDLPVLRAVGKRVWDSMILTKEIIEVRYRVINE